MLSFNDPLLAYQIHFWREQVKTSITKALEITPEDKLNWAPAKDMMSLGNVFLHICETSDWWYDEAICEQASKELVPSHDTPALSKSEIKAHLEKHWERLERFFAREPEMLGKQFVVKGRGAAYQFDGYWAFTHLLEHDLHHRSQINQYLRILGITPPEI